MNQIIEQLANELNVKTIQVAATVKLLDEGATVPFVARYRKEITGGLTDTQLRTLNERLVYLRELNERRETILKSLQALGQLTENLAAEFNAADSKAKIEDLYLPYKPKRHTKAQIAREAGLEPLALALLQATNDDPEVIATDFINPQLRVNDAATALAGARQILLEQFALDPKIVGQLRDYLWDNGMLISEIVPGKEQEGQKFSDYFHAQEKINRAPSHRMLAMLRGQREGILRLKLNLMLEEQIMYCLEIIANQFSIQKSNRRVDQWLAETINLAWKTKLLPKLELESIMRARDQAQKAAIHVFAQNLKSLLLAPPAGGKRTMGLDPGLRTGVKVAIIDQTGQLLNHCTIFPHPPRKEKKQALTLLAKLCRDYQVALISIGNGTASRETDQLVSELIAENPELKLQKAIVSEAGASVYSASELAAAEFPKIDVTIRGAISIARRLQDPLAELVKIDPKAIGVGQYQHDVDQNLLLSRLETVVEDCVNAVGVDVNRASVALLKQVAGLNQSIAEQIVEYRNKQGIFVRREFLKSVPRLGEKTYEQAAGFLRIVDGENPLDASAVHPEAYSVVERILVQTHKSINEVIGNQSFLQSLNPSDYVTDQFGLPTIKDIIAELAKPGRDPRAEFKTVSFQKEIQQISDLKPGLRLSGIVTNVTDFGAFVDVGVHQDGLVHKSVMADRFVSDPATIVQVGQVVSVYVISVDEKRKRISLSMRSVPAEKPSKDLSVAKPTAKKNTVPTNQQKMQPPPKNTLLAQAFAQALSQEKSQSN